jgi:hypothetical protein
MPAHWNFLTAVGEKVSVPAVMPLIPITTLSTATIAKFLESCKRACKSWNVFWALFPNALATANIKSRCGISMVVALQLGMLGASAQTTKYLYSGSETNINLPPGTYTITAYGAPGGSDSVPGGLGAEMSGQFGFSTTTTLTLLVGGGGANGFNGVNGAGGGGGGSFVVNGTTPLVIAGGGGGSGAGGHGGLGMTGTSGGNSGYSGGAGGYGGYGDIAGGGYLGNGGGGGNNGSGGGYVSGGSGGNGTGGGSGGYGGGGGGFAVNGESYGGGGGGYSGGGSGVGYSLSTGGGGAGGGGGSIIGSSAIANLAEISGIASPNDPANGEIIITTVSSAPPTPPALAISTYSNHPAVFFPTAAGASFALQTTTNLTSGNWAAVTNGIPINGIIVTNPPGSAFFRLH